MEKESENKDMKVIGKDPKWYDWINIAEVFQSILAWTVIIGGVILFFSFPEKFAVIFAVLIGLYFIIITFIMDWFHPYGLVWLFMFGVPLLIGYIFGQWVGGLVLIIFLAIYGIVGLILFFADSGGGGDDDFPEPGGFE